MTVEPPAIEAVDATSVPSAVAGLGASEILAGLLDGTTLLGLGWTARTVRELQVVAHGIVRTAVEGHGFGSVLLEGDVDAGAALDRYVTTGDGDPRAVLAGATPYLASEELLGLVTWLRHHNEAHPERAVRIVHGGRDDTETPLAIEESLADQLRAWHAAHGDGIVHLGGAAHVAVDPRRDLAMDPGRRVPSAGSLLREAFGDRLRTVGLTFGHGTIPAPVPPPAPGSLEAALAGLPHATALLRLPADVDARRLRVVGPDYDPAEDERHAMVGDLTTWFDAYLHHRAGHAARPLAAGEG